MKNSIKNNNGETVLKIEYQNKDNLGVSIDHKVTHSYQPIMNEQENDFNQTENNFTLEPKSYPEITDSALEVRGKGKSKDKEDRRKKVMKHLNKHLNKQSA